MDNAHLPTYRYYVNQSSHTLRHLKALHFVNLLQHNRNTIGTVEGLLNCRSIWLLISIQMYSHNDMNPTKHVNVRA